jgi:hypothetical protein
MRGAALKRSQREKPSKRRYTEDNSRLAPRKVTRSLINIGYRLVLETAGIFFHPIGDAAHEAGDLWSIVFEVVGSSSGRPRNASYCSRTSNNLVIQCVLNL